MVGLIGLEFLSAKLGHSQDYRAPAEIVPYFVKDYGLQEPVGLVPTISGTTAIEMALDGSMSGFYLPQRKNGNDCRSSRLERGFSAASARLELVLETPGYPELRQRRLLLGPITIAFVGKPLGTDGSPQQAQSFNLHLYHISWL